MKRSKKLLLILLVIPSALLAIPSAVFIFLASTYLYTTWQVETARDKGIYATPEDGMRALMSRYGGVERVEIEYAGTNSFDGSNPHVRFVVARAYFGGEPNGAAVGEEDSLGGGSYFLRVEDGWVHVPEGAFPTFIGLGMRLFGIYGCREEKSCE